MWEPSPQDIDTLHRTVGRRLKQAMPTIPPSRIDDQIEEIVQSGFLQYMEVIQDPKADTINKPAHWVANASLNKGMNAMRDSGVRRTRESPTDAEGMEVAAQVSGSMEGRALGAINPLNRVLSAEAMATLFAAVRSLTDRQLEVFVKVDIDHERQTDVAKELNTRVGSVEKVLDAARARVWWVVAKSNYEGLCADFYDLIPGLDLSDRPTKKQTSIIAKHVRSCEMCRASICESPLAIDIGLLAGLGVIGGGTSASFGERIVESPIIAKPLSVLDSIGGSVKSGIDKITPGGSHATEAAAGGASTGAGVAGVGGGALVIGGGKIAAICAGGAVTACLAGVATGVVPLPDGKADSTKDKNVVEREADSAGSPESVMTSSSAVDPRVVSRKVNTAKREAQAKREKAAAKQKAEQKAAKQQAEKEAAAAAAEPTTQAATNESSADESFSFSGGSSGGSTSSAPSSSSSSSSSGSSGGTAAPTPQQQTNQSTANASMGCC